ncbi:hypothetical protein L280_03910 [Mannheimia haemolytica MhBrain2012]|nr:hypothetical protein F382_01835 [Mannheimia haemolytica D153]AGQ40250.1 hypothetical protein J451_01550 [Mannheimia haemolytica D174]AGR74936.1 hypothetical protein N220_06290 [Mannheimia haemolytica USMARC_2286]EPZ02751.1 hypothetical protein L279_07810 [Mannheimia haemolytica D38]EPZ22781.1 hypothetical protein L277_07010 [Mannheimia haemolytica D193]EPZ24233.1 hypothetical protein L281_05295 [Mannheimia haemolytica MhSwine2000]EPZ26466.1 hypothetical protein L280_03910 [Mannheimia haemo
MQRNLLVQFLGGGGAVMYFRYPTFLFVFKKAGFPAFFVFMTVVE